MSARPPASRAAAVSGRRGLVPVRGTASARRRAPAAAADSAAAPADNPSPWADLFSKPREKRAENVGGRFYVDSHCINCDVCRRVAPASFGVAGRQSAVLAQPATDAETAAAFQALVSCPT